MPLPLTHQISSREKRIEFAADGALVEKELDFYEEGGCVWHCHHGVASQVERRIEVTQAL